MIKVRILILIGILFFSGKLIAQDIHFSQYYASPLSLNPANTGNFDGSWRFMNNYRNQWSALSIPYRTISVGIDGKIRFWLLPMENFAMGLFFINDKSGPAGLTVNKLYLSIAWHKSFNGHNLHGGIQGGMVFKNFSMDGLTFPSQFDMTTGYFNNQLVTNEQNFQLNTNYADLNFGLAWSKKLRLFEPEFGISFFHLTNPKETFFESNNRLPIRTIYTGGLNVPLGNFYLHPRLLYMRQHRAAEFLGGSEIGYKIPKSNIIKEIFAGYYFRNDYTTTLDAHIAVIGLQIKQFRLGFSYDINSSPLKIATNKRGAFEISLIYISKSTVPQKITIPCDRM